MEAIVEYERGSDFRLTEAELLKRGFGEEPEFGAYVADVGNGHLVGMAVHYEIPFMHSLKPLFMLKWLYVDPQQRGQSIGRSLVKAICKHAVALGYKQFNWFVLHDNENAKHFYRSLGASKDPEWARWIMEEEAVTSLAAEG
ncbi:MAG: GNAT family N-acetyltransferase [Cyanobacteria bacterium J06649_4]